MPSRLPGAVLAALLLVATFPRPAVSQPAPPILVVGGTPAGVAAAVAAARHGADVTLVARGPRLGGILTDAMMDQWDLNVGRDGRTIQGGLFAEIRDRLGDAFTPEQAAELFDRLVAREPRIRVVRGARAVGVAAEPSPDGRRVTAVRFASRGGTFALPASEVIDATDDGDVAAAAGARYDLGRQDTGRDEKMQPVTLMFTLRGVDWAKVVAGYAAARFGPGGASERRAWGYGRLLRRYRPSRDDVLVRDLNAGREPGGDVTVNAIDVLDVDGRSDAELARARAIAEAETPRLIAFLRARVPGFAEARLGAYAHAVYVRETRHFAGVGRLTADAVWSGQIPSDTIGLSSYPLDLHPCTPADRLAYAPIRHVYGIPFGSLVPRGLANVLLASPAISATHIASGSARVIPTTIEEGEAAGVAAALALPDALPFPAFARRPASVAALRGALRRDGAILATAAVASRPEPAPRTR